MGPRAAGDVLDGLVRLEERLGLGGFCSVWRGVDLVTDRHVAVKILHAEHADAPVIRERFEREAAILAALDHPAIPRVFHDATRSASRFFTMEFIRGETLQARLVRHSKLGRPIPLAGIAWILNQIVGPLAYAHANHVVHRDLKPANVMVNEPRGSPSLWVLDFGAAKEIDRDSADPTTVGRVIGSVGYITPEQIRSEATDGRTDQFALAVIVYEALTLRRAWAYDDTGAQLRAHVPLGRHNTQVDIMKRILRGPRPHVRDLRPEVPAGVDDAIVRALAPRPGMRFTSIEAFRDAVYVALLEDPSVAPRWDSGIDGFDDAGPTRSIPLKRPESAYEFSTTEIEEDDVLAEARIEAATAKTTQAVERAPTLDTTAEDETRPHVPRFVDVDPS